MMIMATNTRIERTVPVMIMTRMFPVPATLPVVGDSRSVLCPDGGVCIEDAAPGPSVEVVVTVSLVVLGCDTAVDEAVEMGWAIGIEVFEKIIIENTFIHGMLFNEYSITWFSIPHSNRSK